MSDDNSVERVGGAPAFEAPERVRELETSVGDEFQASMSVGNKGGRAEGIRIVVSGPAIEQGLVEIEELHVVDMAGQDPVVREAREEEDEAGRRRMHGEFPEVVLEGALAADVDFADLSEEEGRRVMQAHRASRISVYAVGRTVCAGKGEIHLELQSVEHPDVSAGQYSHIAVYPTPRLPLPAEPESAPPHTLRQMEKPETLFALVHFGAPVEAWANPASDAIGEWNEAITGEDDAYECASAEEAIARPAEELVDAGRFSDPEELAELAGRFADLYQYTAVVQPVAGAESTAEPRETGGFSYFSFRGAPSGGADSPSPALGFWVGLEDRSEKECAELEETLVGIVDELVRSAPVIQAVLDRWAWAPDMRASSLPFEIVCGYDSSGHLHVDWLERYLRAATRQVWVGPALWSRVDEGEVAAVADVVSLGESRRLVRPSGEEETFERVLEAILPGAEAWDR